MAAHGAMYAEYVSIRETSMPALLWQLTRFRGQAVDMDHHPFPPSECVPGISRSDAASLTTSAGCGLDIIPTLRGLFRGVIAEHS